MKTFFDNVEVMIEFWLTVQAKLGDTKGTIMKTKEGRS